jgi:hypothetical protein
MSLFDRYDKNESELFLRHTCFVSTPQKRFEDLFEQIHQHFPDTQILLNNDESIKNKELIKNINYGDNLSMDRLILHDNDINDLFLESISHLLVFNLVKLFDYPFFLKIFFFNKFIE